MAKWGEGDPRWIVEEREDAKNVNNWHWTEKNATAWSKEKITSLLTKLKVENEHCVAEVTSVTKVEGEAVANNRKAKLIFFYEWNIEAEWKGELKEGENKTKFKGKLEVPNLSEENEAHELDVVVTCEKSTMAAQQVKEFMRTVGAKKVREALGQYIVELKSEYSRGLILPTKKSSEPASTTSSNAVSDTTKSSTPSHDNCGDVSRAGMKHKFSGNLKRLHLTETFFCAPQDLYKVFTEEEALRSFTRAEAKCDNRVGGTFALFGGSVTGTFVELDPSACSVTMRWRRNHWPTGCESTVKLAFANDEEGTRLDLTQEGIPQEELESTTAGWKMHYFVAIKQTFGYGGRMF